jgi:hypothetical protein
MWDHGLKVWIEWMDEMMKEANTSSLGMRTVGEKTPSRRGFALMVRGDSLLFVGGVFFLFELGKA